MAVFNWNLLEGIRYHPPSHLTIVTRDAMDRPSPGPQEERLLRILADVEASMARGDRPDLTAYCARFPDLEEDLRAHFRRLGLIVDPFQDAAQYRRELPPWESPQPDRPEIAAAPQHPPPSSSSRPFERDLLIENLVRPSLRTERGWRIGRRTKAALAIALAFAAGWGGLVVLERVSRPVRRPPSAGSRIQGISALLALAPEWPQARSELLSEATAEADRTLPAEGELWEVRWLRFLCLQELGREAEASRDLDAIPARVGRRLMGFEDPRTAAPGGESADVAALAALGEVLGKRIEKAKEILQAPTSTGDQVLASIVRGAVDPGRRKEALPLLLASPLPSVRLLGAVWGIRAGDASARDVLRSLPLDGIAAARMLVELGEEETFLQKTRPGRIDLAPIRMVVLSRHGRRDEARKIAEALLNANPGAFDLRMALVRILLEDGAADAASAHLRAAAPLRPESPEPMREWMHLAARHLDRPDILLPCAEIYLQRASAGARASGLVEGGSPGAGVEAGKDLGGTGPSPERLPGAGFGLPAEEEVRTKAIDAITRAVAWKPDDPALLFLLGRMLFAEGRWAEAASRFESAEKAADAGDRPAIGAWRAAAVRRALPAPSEKKK
jgi:tetratricopeptide (TPR) repeat protein